MIIPEDKDISTLNDLPKEDKEGEVPTPPKIVESQETLDEFDNFGVALTNNFDLEATHRDKWDSLADETQQFQDGLNTQMGSEYAKVIQEQADLTRNTIAAEQSTLIQDSLLAIETKGREWYTKLDGFVRDANYIAERRKLDNGQSTPGNLVATLLGDMNLSQEKQDEMLVVLFDQLKEQYGIELNDDQRSRGWEIFGEPGVYPYGIDKEPREAIREASTVLRNLTTASTRGELTANDGKLLADNMARAKDYVKDLIKRFPEEFLDNDFVSSERGYAIDHQKHIELVLNYPEGLETWRVGHRDYAPLRAKTQEGFSDRVGRTIDILSTIPRKRLIAPTMQQMEQAFMGTNIPIPVFDNLTEDDPIKLWFDAYTGIDGDRNSVEFDPDADVEMLDRLRRLDYYKEVQSAIEFFGMLDVDAVNEDVDLSTVDVTDIIGSAADIVGLTGIGNNARHAVPPPVAAKWAPGRRFVNTPTPNQYLTGSQTDSMQHVARNVVGSPEVAQHFTIDDTFTELEAIEDILSGAMYRRMMNDPNNIYFNPAFQDYLNTEINFLNAALGSHFAGRSETSLPTTDEALKQGREYVSLIGGSIADSELMNQAKTIGNTIFSGLVKLVGGKNAGVIAGTLINPLTNQTAVALIKAGMSQEAEEKTDVAIRAVQESILKSLEELSGIRDQQMLINLKMDSLKHERDNLSNTHPETIRQWSMARRLKEEGFTDPSGHNWENPETFDSATKSLVVSAAKGDLGVDTAAWLLPLYEQSFADSKHYGNLPGSASALNSGIGKLVTQMQTINTKTTGGLTDAMFGGDPTLQQHMKDGQVLSEDNQQWILDTVQNYNAIINDTMLEMFPPEVLKGWTPEERQHLLTAVIDEDAMLRGEWGINYDELSTVQLGALLRAHQVYGQEHKRTTIPKHVQATAAALAKRASYFDGKNDANNAVTPKEQREGALAISFMSRIRSGENNGGWTYEQMFSGLPEGVRAILDSLVILAPSSKGWLTSVEYISKYGIHGDRGGDEVGDFAPWSMTEEIRYLTSALNAANQTPVGDQKGSDKTTDIYTAIDNLAGGASVYMTLMNDNSKRTPALIASMQKLGVIPSFQKKGNIITKDSTALDTAHPETQRLVHLLSTSNLVSPSVYGDGMDAQDLEQKLFKVFSMNNESRNIMRAIVTSYTSQGRKVSSMDILETTVNLLAIKNLKLIRTGPKDEDIEIISFNNRTPGFSDAISSGVIPNARHGVDDDRTIIHSVMGTVPPFVPSNNRTADQWDNNVVPTYTSFRNTIFQQLTSLGAFDQTNPATLDIINKSWEALLREEKNDFLESGDNFQPRTYSDLLLGVLHRYLDEAGLNDNPVVSRLYPILQHDESKGEGLQYPRKYDVRWTLKADNGAAALRSPGSNAGMHVELIVKGANRREKKFDFSDLGVESLFSLVRPAWKDFAEEQKRIATASSMLSRGWDGFKSIVSNHVSSFTSLGQPSFHAGINKRRANTVRRRAELLWGRTHGDSWGRWHDRAPQKPKFEKGHLGLLPMNVPDELPDLLPQHGVPLF